jgi:hypothetical protein
MLPLMFALLKYDVLHSRGRFDIKTSATSTSCSKCCTCVLKNKSKYYPILIFAIKHAHTVCRRKCTYIHTYIHTYNIHTDLIYISVCLAILRYKCKVSCISANPASPHRLTLESLSRTLSRLLLDAT